MEDSDALHTDFREICMTLFIVTAANNSSHPTLEPSMGIGQHHIHSMSMGDDNQVEAVVVSSFVNLLIRRSGEVAAMTTYQTSQDATADIENLRHGLPSGLIVFVNASKDHSHFQNTDYQITIVKNSQSHWPSISPLQHLDVLDPNKLIIPKNDPFENHLATMTDFINEYREEKDTKKRIRLFWKFSAYISLVSWPKTYQRLMNWTSKGFVHTLTRVPLNELRSRAKNLRDTNPMRKRSNNSLLSDVSSLCKQDGAVKDLMDRLSSIEFEGSHYKPDNLNDLLHGLEAEKDDPTCSAYNEVTAIQFHFLLLAILVGYITVLKERDYIRAEEGKATESEAKMRAEQKKEAARKRAVRNELRKQEAKQCAMKNSERAAITRIEGEGGTVRRIEEDEGRMAKKNETNEGRTSESKEDKKTTPNLTECQRRVWQYGRILWTVTSSRMFDDYLQSLQGLLGVVNPNQMSLYTSLFKDLGLEDDVRNGHIEDVEEEQRMLMDLKAPTPEAQEGDSVVRFKFWARLITSHLGSLHEVTTPKTTSRQSRLQTKLIVTKVRENRQLLNWHRAIRSVCDQNEEASVTMPSTDDDDAANSTQKDRERSIQLIQNYINRNCDMFSDFGAVRMSSDNFAFPQLNSRTSQPVPGNAQVGTVYWTGKEHCELLAAVLLLYLDQVIPSGEGLEDLRNLITSCHARGIYVSKLCCPICWELLQILWRNKKQFRMRGFHTSFYPVDLPLGLPKDVLKEMVTRFRIHLRQEVQTLLSGPRVWLNHKPSQSQDSFLTGTNSSVYLLDPDVENQDIENNLEG